MARQTLRETDWTTADRWQDLLVAMFPDNRYTKAAGTQRKLRLLLCAAARLGWNVLPEDRCRRAIETAEQFAEGQATTKQLTPARDAAQKAFNTVEQSREDRETTARTEFEKRLQAAGSAEEWSDQWPADLALPVAEQLRAEFAARIVVCASAASIDRAGLEKGLMYVPDVVAPVEQLAARLPKWYEVGDEDPPDPRPDLIREIFGYPFAPVTVPANWRTKTVSTLADEIATASDFDRLPILADALEEAGCDDARLLTHCRSGGLHVRGCWALDAVRGVHWQPTASPELPRKGTKRPRK